MQVSGRAGRREKQGHVIIQTYSPEHPVLRDVINADYSSFYTRELDERQRFLYPPYYYRIAIWFRHKDFTKAKKAAEFCSAALYKIYGGRVVGPVDPPIVRLRNKYHQVVFVRIEKKGQVITKVKADILQFRGQLRQKDAYKSVLVSIDVDPWKDYRKIGWSG